MKPCKLMSSARLSKQFAATLISAMSVFVVVLIIASEPSHAIGYSTNGDQAIVDERAAPADGASLAVIQNPRQVALVLDGLLRSIVYSAAEVGGQR